MLKFIRMRLVVAVLLLGGGLHANCVFVLHEMGIHAGVTNLVALHSFRNASGWGQIGNFHTHLTHRDYFLVYPAGADPILVGWVPRFPPSAFNSQNFFSQPRDGELYEIGVGGEIQIVSAHFTDRPVLVRAVGAHLYYQAVSGAFFSLSPNPDGTWKNEQWLKPNTPIKNLTGGIGNVVSYDVRSRTADKLEIIVLTETRLLSIELTRTPAGDVGPANCLGEYLVAQGQFTIHPMISEVWARGNHVWVKYLYDHVAQLPHYFALDANGAFSPAPPLGLSPQIAAQYGPLRHWALRVDPSSGALHEAREYGAETVLTPAVPGATINIDVVHRVFPEGLNITGLLPGLSPHPLYQSWSAPPSHRGMGLPRYYSIGNSSAGGVVATPTLGQRLAAALANGQSHLSAETLATEITNSATLYYLFDQMGKSGSECLRRYGLSLGYYRLSASDDREIDVEEFGAAVIAEVGEAEVQKYLPN